METINYNTSMSEIQFHKRMMLKLIEDFTTTGGIIREKFWLKEPLSPKRILANRDIYPHAHPGQEHVG